MLYCKTWVKAEDEKTVLGRARTLTPRAFLHAALAPEMTLFLAIDEEAVWKILGREGIEPETHAALFEALQAAPPGRLRDLLRWAAEDGLRERLLAACGEPVSDDLSFLSRMAALDSTEEAAAFLLAGAASLAKLSSDDRAWTTQLFAKHPDHLPCAAALLNRFDELAPGRAADLKLGFLRAWLAFDVAALFVTARFREMDGFLDVLARGNVLALPLIASEIEIAEDGEIVSFERAEEEIDKIHDRGDLYLDDYEIGSDGQVQIRTTTIVREAIPGGDVYQAAKILFHGKRVTLGEAGWALLDGGCIALDLFSLGAASTAKNAAKVTAKGAKLAGKIARLARLGRLAAKSRGVRGALRGVAGPVRKARLAAKAGRFLDALGLRPGSLSLYLNGAGVTYAVATRKRTVNTKALNRELTRLADELRKLKEASQ
jgi:hypothetical protein